MAFVRLLLSAGARVNAANKDHLTPLHVAVLSEHSDLAALLVSHGAELDPRWIRNDTSVLLT